MTQEEIVALQQRRTEVKDTCFEAVISGVLHVYDIVLDSKGNRYPIRETTVRLSF